jgi:hypothetical protein
MQGELSINSTLAGWSPTFSLGMNFVCNRKSIECSANIDFAPELYSGGMGEGGSVTGGVLFGWGSSQVSDVTSGRSQIIGGTAAAGPAISVTIATPLNDSGDKLHVDSIYGQVPTTVYIGGGAGGVYAGVGAGKSTSLYP